MGRFEFIVHSKFATAIALLLIWIFVGTVTFHFFEDWTWIESFYFSVVTLTTIGFGDLVPTSDFTRFLASIYILAGVSAVLASLTIIGNTVIKQYQDRLLRENQKLKKKVEVLTIIDDVPEKYHKERLERENRHLRNIIKSIKTAIEPKKSSKTPEKS